MEEEYSGQGIALSIGDAAVRGDELFQFLRSQPRIAVGGGLILLLLIGAVLAPLIAPYNPTTVDTSQALIPPSATHLLGTDDLGRDIFSRVLWGARISLSVGVISVSIGFLAGVTIGLVAGYAGGTID